MLYIFGFGTARLGEWRLNHIHSVNGAEVINASVSDSSAEIDYRWGSLRLAPIRTLARMRARTWRFPIPFAFVTSPTVMSVEEGGVEVRESAVPGPSESRDESEIDRRRCVLLHSLARGMMRMRSPSCIYIYVRRAGYRNFYFTVALRANVKPAH